MLPETSPTRVCSCRMAEAIRDERGVRHARGTWREGRPSPLAKKRAQRWSLASRCNAPRDQPRSKVEYARKVGWSTACFAYTQVAISQVEWIEQATGCCLHVLAIFRSRLFIATPWNASKRVQMLERMMGRSQRSFAPEVARCAPVFLSFSFFCFLLSILLWVFDCTAEWR